jgi:hypothetical protein
MQQNYLTMVEWSSGYDLCTTGCNIYTTNCGADAGCNTDLQSNVSNLHHLIERLRYIDCHLKLCINSLRTSRCPRDRVAIICQSFLVRHGPSRKVTVCGALRMELQDSNKPSLPIFPHGKGHLCKYFYLLTCLLGQLESETCEGRQKTSKSSYLTPSMAGQREMVSFIQK